MGSFLSTEGNRANSVKGIAKASAKANMPNMGPTKLPLLAVSTRSVPMIGPVHENDTITRVNAMKKMLGKLDFKRA